MRTFNPRVGLTLKSHRYDLLKRMAALQGVSMASLVTELLEEFYPVLERVCVALEMAKGAQESSKAGLRKAADRAQAEIQPMLDASMSQFDMFMGKLEGALNKANSEGEGVPACGESTISESPLLEFPAERVDPRIVTRGSGTKSIRPASQRKPRNGKALKGDFHK